MSDFTENNKRIAKNTLLLYLRMFISMAITLYTSRVIINALGVEDYGIYGVVGGVVSVFAFLTVSMANATSRFLTYELGRGDKLRLQHTFTTAYWEHVFIATIVAILVESIGVWFLNHKMDIPANRLYAANIVLQMAILSMMGSVMKVPFSASVISHEQMEAFAYIELIDVVLRLAIVFILMSSSIDKLIMYSILSFAVVVIMYSVYVFYCKRHYEECRVRFEWHPAVFRSMMKFSGWDLYGNASVVARTQGVNILLNLFFGPVVNAAAGIATQVQGAVMGFGSNVTTAVKPQIVKYYAQGEFDRMASLIRNAVKLNYIILLLPTVPLAAELNFVVTKWLGVLPNWTVIFCQLTLLFNMFTSIAGILVSGIHATGKNILPSVINGSLYLLVIPFSYFAYKSGAAPWVSFAFNVVAVFFGMLSNAIVLNSYVSHFSIHTFLCKDMPHFIFVMAISFTACVYAGKIIPEGWLRLVVTITLSSLIILLYSYFFIIPKTVSQKLINKLIHKE